MQVLSYSTVFDTFRYVLKCFEVLPLTLLFKIAQHPTVLENKKRRDFDDFKVT